MRSLHPDWIYLFFCDADVEDFVRERQPSWWSLYQQLTHAPIQRIDLFRYLAVEHYGGVYLDVDMLVLKPLDELLAVQAVSAPAPRLAPICMGMRTFMSMHACMH